MAGGNSSLSGCSDAALKQLASQITCDHRSMSSLNKSMGEKMWRVNALQITSAILTGLIVGIGIYRQCYRHHRFTGFFFLGATTLFLPVVSTVVSMGAGENDYTIEWPNKDNSGFDRLIAKCKPHEHSVLVVVWASLVQIIMINTSAVVAVDDREGGSIGPPFQLLVQGVWTFYLGTTYIISSNAEYIIVIALEVVPFALICTKMVFKYYAFEKARQSFALGRNPHLIFGYMKQQSLQETSHQGEPVVAKDAPPPLLVMGEEKRHVKKQPLGYVFKDDPWEASHNNELVTIDRVWRLGNMLPTSTGNLQKDICFSFALFKLLRCLFARYKVRNNAGSKDAFNLFWSLLLKDGEHDKVFLVISNEISFLYDYYYSSLPIYYSKYWLPSMGIFISLLCIVCCCALLITLLMALVENEGYFPQVMCSVFCTQEQLVGDIRREKYGSWYLDLVLIFLLLVLVMMAEVRDIASYICSNWTKVALICHLVNHASSQHSSILKKKWIGHMLHCRCKMMNYWDEKIGQCSILEIRPSTTLIETLRRLLHLPDQKRKVKLPAALKVCIMEVLRSSRNGPLGNGTTCLRRRDQVGERFLWACNNESTSYTILTWHIATSILEIRYTHPDDEEQGSSTNYNIAATRLSRYCTYLVTWCPELLPDDHEWSGNLYEDVKKDAVCVLVGWAPRGSLTPEAKCQKLIELLVTNAKHEVLKEGARLGEQLVELMSEGDETDVWKLMAEFWSEMILYVAPSDNLEGHKEAIAMGGELITMLWVLLFHAGIVSRPGQEDGAASTSAGVV